MNSWQNFYVKCFSNTGKIGTVILVSVFQILALVLTHELIYVIFPIFDVGFGITLMFSGLFFMFLVLIFNFHLKFWKKRNYLIGFIIWSFSIILPLGAIPNRPWRVLLLVILFLLTLWSSILISKWRNDL